MSTSRVEALALFSDEDDAFYDEPDTAAGKRHLRTRTRALEMAAWCLATRQSREAYMACTRDERDAFLELINRR